MSKTWSIPPERAGRAAPEKLAATRAAMVGRVFGHPVQEGAAPREVTIGGVACIEASVPNPRCELLYFHGGGYRLGNVAGFGGWVSVLATRLKARVIAPEYRTAPEHPFPAAIHDGAKVLRALDRKLPLFIGGDSAGGGLTAAVTLAAINAGEAKPAGLLLFSPWLDTELKHELSNRDMVDAMFPMTSASEAAETYLQGWDARDPLASPIFADPGIWPPTLVLAGGAEMLLADALRFTQQVTLAGGSVTLHAAANMQHVWPIMFPDLPETADALRVIDAFVEARLA